MNPIIEHLKSFNSKERFFLISYILGNAAFTPSPAFRESIANTLCLQLPREVFGAIDYHLDWLYASLYLALKQEQSVIFMNDGHLIRGQQEDIDFLFAYDTNNVCHIILLEAKGVGCFTNKQMKSKAGRFAEIFGMDGMRWPFVVPHFALISPNPPTQRLQNSAWPAWMAPNNVVPWIKLSLPPGLKKVTLCNQRGEADQSGKCWTISCRR